jgi:hypothetical protein
MELLGETLTLMFKKQKFSVNDECQQLQKKRKKNKRGR